MYIIILVGCTKLTKVTLHNNDYIDDRAIKGLSYGKSTITHVQVSQCVNVTDAGLKEIKALRKLQHLVLFGLISVENLEECKLIIQAHLPTCKVEGRQK